MTTAAAAHLQRGCMFRVLGVKAHTAKLCTDNQDAAFLGGDVQGRQFECGDKAQARHVHRLALNTGMAQFQLGLN